MANSETKNTHKMPAFPHWVRRPWPSGTAFQEVKSLLEGLELHTVCQSAHCPNQAECWGRGTATMMVMGNVCTRHCTYCAVNSGKPEMLDAGEPAKIANAVQRLNLKHLVITSVTRDDLPDQGAGHIAACIHAIHEISHDTSIEVLVQDFNGDQVAIRTVIEAGPEVFSHNIETVARLHPKLRDRRFTYASALDVLKFASGIHTNGLVKSAFMLGCGESDDEIKQTIKDLYDAGCHAISIGQYLQPTARHYPVQEYVSPERFAEYENFARDIGIPFAVAGPFVRSSYRSEALLETPFAKTRLASRRKPD